jgi:hypothetical protein
MILETLKRMYSPSLLVPMYALPGIASGLSGCKELAITTGAGKDIESAPGRDNSPETDT